jgi:hypothetical protein
MPATFEETRAMPYDSLIIAVVATAVVSVVAIILGWQIAAILAAAVIANGAGASARKRGSR